MSTNIVNSVLTNNDGKELNGSVLKSAESQSLNKLNNESSLKKINISAESIRPYKVNIFEGKDDWLVSKKDSERTIIDNDCYHVLKTNKDSCSSLLHLEKINKTNSLKDGIAFDKPGQLSHSETLINDDNFETIPFDKLVPITHSETLVNEETIRTTTTEKSDPVTVVTHSETLVNEGNYRNYLTEHADHSIDSLESLYDFSPVVDEIISDNSMLIDSLEHFEMDPKETYTFENNNLQVENFDGSLVTFSDDSLSYDNIFNYNSNIILSDDEDIRREKIEELYNEAVIMNNLDDNTFAFMNEDSYNEYLDNSMDNSGSTDYSLFERDPNISHKRSSLPKSLDLNLPANHEFNNMKYINKDVKLFDNMPVNTIYPDEIEESTENRVISPNEDNKFVSADDDAIYVIDDGYVDDDDELQQETKNKKKVTFNEKVKIKRIDRIDIHGNNIFKSYFKNSFKKLKKLFTNGDSKKVVDKVIHGYQGELPVVTIEYVDDYYDTYNKKEVLFFGEDYPRIIIDFTDDYYDVDGYDYDDQYYNYPDIYQDEYQMYQDCDVEDNNHHLSGTISENANKLINDDSEVNQLVSAVNETVNTNENKDEVPFYLREATPQITKEKKRIAKKLIDRVINMEKSYYQEKEKVVSKEERVIESSKVLESPKEQEELINSEEKAQTTSTEVLKESPEIKPTTLSNSKPVLKKKSKSMSYIKNVYKSLKHSLSMNDTLKSKSDDEEDKEEKDISNTGIFESNVEDNNNIISVEGNEEKTEFHLFDNGSDTSVDNEAKKVEKEIDINKLIDNRLEKVQSSLTTVVGEDENIEVEKVEVVDSDRKEGEEILKSKKSKSFLSLFKKSNRSKSSIANTQQIEIDNNENNNDDKENNNDVIKDNKTNSHSFFTHIKHNFKSKTTSEQQQEELQQEQEEIFTTSTDKNEEELQQEIENDLPISYEKMDSSLTETDILAKQISNLSSSFDIDKNSSTVDYTQLSNQIAESSLITNEADYIFSLYSDNINQQEEDKQNYQMNSNEIKNESSSMNNQTMENENIPPTSSQKTFKPVVLPIDNENNFNIVDTIEIIDEYIFDSPNPILYYTNGGKEEEISEIIIEDRFIE